MPIRDVVDSAWAELFGPVDLRSPGVRVIFDPPGLDYRRIFLLRLGDGCTIGAPSDITIDVAGMSPDEVFDPDVAGHFADGLILGPSWHGYLDATSFVKPEPCDARRLQDGPLVDAFKGDIAPDEWSEGGFGHELDVAYGCFDGDELVAMGNMTDFAGHPADVGLVTHPKARGKGYGTRLAGAMIADALETIEVLRYRALFTNLPSMAVARKLGFVGEGANIVVRLAD